MPDHGNQSVEGKRGDRWRHLSQSTAPPQPRSPDELHTDIHVESKRHCNGSRAPPGLASPHMPDHGNQPASDNHGGRCRHLSQSSAPDPQRSRLISHLPVLRHPPSTPPRKHLRVRRWCRAAVPHPRRPAAGGRGLLRPGSAGTLPLPHRPDHGEADESPHAGLGSIPERPVIEQHDHQPPGSPPTSGGYVATGRGHRSRVLPTATATNRTSTYAEGDCTSRQRSAVAPAQPTLYGPVGGLPA